MADTAKPKYDKQAWQDENEIRTKELTEKLEAGIKDLFSSDKYKAYLTAMSHFHNYSRRNIMLIHSQMPSATKVASFKLWKEKFNRSPKRGETSLRIFAPVERKPKTELFEKLDPATGKPMLDANGKVIMEEMTDVNSLRVAFKLVPVFDVSQTVGDPLPYLAEDLTGNVEHYEAFLDTLKAISPLPIVFEPMDENQDGYCQYGTKIGIREGMSEIQTVSAIIHEITHARLHDKDLLAANDTPKSKDVKEIEAESVSFVVCGKYGIETGDNSFGYLATWSNHDLDEFKASQDTIRNEANSLINAIDDRFKAICKERGIDLTAAEPPQQEQPQQSATAENTQMPTPSTEKTAEPIYATESTTENIAGVDFTVNEVVPTVSNSLQTAAENDPAHDFVTDYYQYILDVYRNGVPRDTPAQVESNNAELADMLRNGKTESFREAIERAGNNSNTQERAAALLQRLDEMLPHTAQLAEPAEILTDQTKSIEQQIYEKLSELFPQVIGGEYSYQRLEAGEAMMPLSLEWIDTDKLSIMHTYTQNGDLMYDPMIVLQVDQEAQTATAVEFQQSNPSIYQVIDEDGIGHSIDGNGNERTINGLQGQIDDFVSTWADNLKAQGYMPERANIIINGGEVRITFDKDGIPIPPEPEADGQDSDFYHIGSGPTESGVEVWNWNEPNDKDGQPKFLATINFDREITYLDDNLPDDVKADIEGISQTDWKEIYAIEMSGMDYDPPPPPWKRAETVTDQSEPMPDSTISTAERDAFGYTAEDILPLNKDRAVELFNNDHAIFMLYPDNTEAMAFEVAEIEVHDGIFGIEREDWQKSQEYRDMANKTNQQQEAAIESDFINSKEDTFAIYQIMDGKDFSRDYRFEGLDYLEQRGWEVNRNHYVIVHTEPLTPETTLEGIYQKFNIDRPENFSGHSLSVSDVVVFNQGGEITSHFVDSIGFSELPAFLGMEKQPVQSVPTVETPEIPKNQQPIYKQSADHAMETDELKAWRDSRDLNIECGKAIDQAITASNYEQYRYDLKTAARDVIEEFGADRVAWVIASNVNHNDWDGRLSNDNKAWAKDFDTPKPDIHLKTHLAVLDGFAKCFRATEKEKPSLMAALKAGEQKSKAEFDGKAQPGMDTPDKSAHKKNTGMEV